VIKVDPDRLRSYHLSPQDVVAAIDQGNYVSPSGNVTIKDQFPVVPANTMVLDPQELRNIPLKLGENVYVRDVGTVEDATDIPVGYALVDGHKSVYLPVVKQADASTLTVVNAVKQNLKRFQAALPDDVGVDYEFDESPIVYRAIESVGVEGAPGRGADRPDGPGLPPRPEGRDRRGAQHPAGAAGVARRPEPDREHHQHHDAGGLALAIGILVDEATVEIENIHTQMEHTPSMARAVRQGNMETAVPRLLALLCILSVFIPSFIMEGAVRALFVAALSGGGRLDGHVVLALQHARAGPEHLAPGKPTRDARGGHAAGVLLAVSGLVRKAGDVDGRTPPRGGPRVPDREPGDRDGRGGPPRP